MPEEVVLQSKSISDDKSDFEVVAKVKKVSTAFKTIDNKLSYLYHFFELWFWSRKQVIVPLKIIEDVMKLLVSFVFLFSPLFEICE